MTEKEIRRMSRLELLQVLLEQGKRLQSAEEAVAHLLEENARLREELEDRKIRIEEAGSIARASLELNEVFQAAQRAADMYLENIRSRALEINAQQGPESIRENTETDGKQGANENDAAADAIGDTEC